MRLMLPRPTPQLDSDLVGLFLGLSIQRRQVRLTSFWKNFRTCSPLRNFARGLENIFTDDVNIVNPEISIGLQIVSTDILSLLPDRKMQYACN